ncbi:Predicted thiol-disulfide oxidoreductase YuxK, DCC family [Roseovarius nanhaiticus]|uniref:Predicted thiol-disulfide oxidoreductase YuxK, DCC family n=1 Tax=Roseovarius nanhaiticus TaxID=573024 RepID=A0A1N7HGS3_9RHOB|nr:DUF393 domain-containing protein [Roseovarius nanhaiticus]SEK96345.1 Predicted thiol-disulfide oxidoreductase YuxK, DCC family [Roseovarius nanhaiticus]SIS23880.1 Predicted thiol-disulfide oxidoreductase YuxK, DCC family [Roseovarius nanhaiticus]
MKDHALVACENRENAAITVYYDGACPLCRAELSHYARRDREGRLGLVDVSQEGANLPEGLGPEEAKARFHVLTPDAQLTSGAAAFAEVWRQVPGWKWAARIARVPGVLPVLELAYRGFLKIRPQMVGAFKRLSRS